ncbi:MAG: hypothetical protein MPJ50_02740 [Pirellulales bacterium]|nr:hypothetical protein [Pirellulales bacterium]
MLRPQTYAQLAKMTADFRERINPAAGHVTWLTAEPSRLLADNIVKAQDEVGLISPGANCSRKAIGASLRAAARELRQHDRELATIGETVNSNGQHVDLAAKAGCSTVLRAGGTTTSTRRTQAEPSPLKRGRFGLWVLSSTRTLSTRRDVTRAAKQLKSDLVNGLTHLVLAPIQDDLGAALISLCREVDQLTTAGEIALKTVDELTRAHAVATRSRPAESILRRAA